MTCLVQMTCSMGHAVASSLVFLITTFLDSDKEMLQLKVNILKTIKITKQIGKHGLILKITLMIKT
jgi:hypothetical protein